MHAIDVVGGEQWEVVRDLRLRALHHVPDAFASTYEAESLFDESRWRSFIADVHVIVVKVDGEPAAMVTVDSSRHDGDVTAWLGGLWVEPRFRGHGLVRAIVSFIDDQRDTYQWHSLGLGVFTHNPDARNKFLSLGFVDDGEELPSVLRPPLRYQRMIRRPQA